MVPLRIVELGVNHPHGKMLRVTMSQHDGIELVGAYDPQLTRAVNMLAGEQINIPMFDDVNAALSETKPDAVLITLPNDVTPDAIVASAAKGLHIFAEKPSAVSATEFARAHDAVVEAKVQFVSGYLRRFSPVANALRQMIAEGLLGELVAAQTTYVTTSAELRNETYLAGYAIEDRTITDTEPLKPTSTLHWLFDRERSGGGIMHWLGVHWIDLLRFVTQHEFVSANATLASRSPLSIDVEDVASVSLESDAGLLATISCAYLLPRGPDQLCIAFQGSLGWATWDGVGPDLYVHTSHPAWRSAPTRTLRFEADDVPGYSGALGREAFEQFRSAILDEGQLPMDVTDALRTLQILDAIQLSGRERQRVAI